MKILVTGFQPFGGEAINPAWEAVKLLPNEIQGAKIIREEIPTAFEECEKAIERSILKNKPDVVVCVGQAGGRSCISIEKVGINLMEASIPDNRGNQPIDKIIKEDGPVAYFSSLPVKVMVKNLREHGIPGELSYTAGTYVCNNLLYSLMYLIEKKYPGIKGGFIHVPFSCEQASSKAKGTPSMSVETIAKGLEYAIFPIAAGMTEARLEMGEIQ